MQQKTWLRVTCGLRAPSLPPSMVSCIGRNWVGVKVWTLALELGVLWSAVMCSDGLGAQNGLWSSWVWFLLCHLLAWWSEVVSWVEWGSPHLPLWVCLEDQGGDLWPSAMHMGGGAYSVYPYNWRLLGMGYMLQTESHHESKFFFFSSFLYT